jgi:hypothetical protein
MALVADATLDTLHEFARLAKIKPFSAAEFAYLFVGAADLLKFALVGGALHNH